VNKRNDLNSRRWYLHGTEPTARRSRITIHPSRY